MDTTQPEVLARFRSSLRRGSADAVLAPDVERASAEFVAFYDRILQSFVGKLAPAALADEIHSAVWENVNTTRYDKGDVGMVDPINYLGRPGRRWFAARLTDGGDEWSEQERNYAIAADDTHQGEPCCMDQRGRAPYKVGDVVTDNQGDEPACNCGE